MIYDYTKNMNLIFFLLWGYIMIIGAALGSFLNVVASRLPLGMSLWGRSRCDSCHQTIKWYDLIPVFSYLFLRSRCRNCKHPIPASHFFFEIITGALFLFWFYRINWQFTYEHWLLLVLILVALAIGLADYYYQVIPDQLLIVFLIATLLLRFNVLHIFLLGSLLIAFLFWMINHFSHGTAMGYGDVKYVFVIGLALPLQSLLLAIYLAFLTGGIVSAILILLRKKKMKSTVSFGPFLSLGFITALCFLI
ncbi:hypothetical protein A2403_00765 [Candidatus Roizmanbacteria bacterium RIFOXYC1_FULL_41_16]|nr:MAG: hypothetical protein A2377_00425 [Candidatus Roizmanbacteria bacterium RIFOXYB1_FULL_41_27]OGK71522.1 MAG: hypothetical protein A2403_00765 [Candidatus Roizmanbacteria bacterium RIFOXYC1_FULL_41_16]